MEEHDIAIYVYEPTDPALTPAFRPRCSCGWAGRVVHDRREAHMVAGEHEDISTRSPAPSPGAEGR